MSMDTSTTVRAVRVSSSFRNLLAAAIRESVSAFGGATSDINMVAKQRKTAILQVADYIGTLDDEDTRIGIIHSCWVGTDRSPRTYVLEGMMLRVLGWIGGPSRPIPQSSPLLDELAYAAVDELVTFTRQKFSGMVRQKDEAVAAKDAAELALSRRADQEPKMNGLRTEVAILRGQITEAKRNTDVFRALAGEGEAADLVPGEQHRAEVAQLKAEVERLEQEKEDSAKFLEAAEYSLGRFGQKVQNKPGRKPAKDERAAA